jgi:hypothetical protein
MSPTSCSTTSGRHQPARASRARAPAGAADVSPNPSSAAPSCTRQEIMWAAAHQRVALRLGDLFGISALHERAISGSLAETVGGPHRDDTLLLSTLRLAGGGGFEACWCSETSTRCSRQNAAQSHKPYRSSRGGENLSSGRQPELAAPRHGLPPIRFLSSSMLMPYGTAHAATCSLSTGSGRSCRARSAISGKPALCSRSTTCCLGSCTATTSCAKSLFPTT